MPIRSEPDRRRSRVFYRQKQSLLHVGGESGDDSSRYPSETLHAPSAAGEGCLSDLSQIVAARGSFIDRSKAFFTWAVNPVTTALVTLAKRYTLHQLREKDAYPI